jgi:hypothetical protein
MRAMKHRFLERTISVAVGALVPRAPGSSTLHSLRPLHGAKPGAGFGLLLLALACTPEAPLAAGAQPLVAQVFDYAGPAGTSHVTLQRASDGVESLHGRTDVAPGPKPAHIGMEETATLDASGRLRQAEIVTRDAGAPVSYRLNPSRATVRIERAGAAPIEWRVPNDAPWLYGPTLDASGQQVVTPVSAWIALRATQAGSVVRVLEPERQESHLMSIDQLAVVTEHGKTVALGFGADVDDRFVSELRWVEGCVGLSRVAGFDPGA